jgi:4-aminobutyrate aminotransferase-like enzyme/aminoglycoside phosphotransferase (APT) family kinase protein
MTDDPPGTDPLVVSPPAVDASRARAIAAREFGRVGEVTALGGERDQNFRLDTADAAYVLKISNSQDGPETLDLQTEAIRHVSRTSDVPVMEVVPTVDGDPWATVTVDGETHLVRLFTLVPGEEPSVEDLSEAALFDYGASVAEVGVALRGFFHPEARYEILWDLRYAPDLRALVPHVADDERRALAERVLDRIDERVAPVFDSLRAQVIHNDLTLDNVLLDDSGRVSGVVDFGDLTHTALVCDLAIALASVMHRRTDPMEAAEAVVRGYVSVASLDEMEAKLLGDLVAARLLSWGVIVAWRAAEHPEKTDHTTAGVDDGWALLHALEERGFDTVGRRLRTAALSGEVPYSRLDTTALHGRRRAVLGESPLSYRDPVHFVGGEGVWLFDPEGRRYLDAYNNVQVVGHGNPRVAAAIGGQARTLATNTRYLHEAAVELAERLLTTLPSDFDRLLFVNSGSEANDLAWRLATAATGNDGAVVSEYAYHGITDRTVDLSPDIWPEGSHPDHVETVPPPAAPGTHRGAAIPDAGEAMADALDRLGSREYDPAAFVFDTLFTSDGIFPPDGDRLAAMADRVHDAGGLVVADEVQAGFGRTGTDLWGFQATDVVPDIVTMGKPMGNGHPVAAVATRSDVTAPLMDRTGLFSTFGGNPVSCVAALAVLDVIEEESLLAQVDDVGASLHEGLTELAACHEAVGDLRRQGLMVGVELVSDTEWTPATEATNAVVERLRQRRVLVGSASEAGNVLKIRPPLVFEHDHADRLLDALDDVLTEVEE